MGDWVEGSFSWSCGCSIGIVRISFSDTPWFLNVSLNVLSSWQFICFVCINISSCLGTAAHLVLYLGFFLMSIFLYMLQLGATCCLCVSEHCPGSWSTTPYIEPLCCTLRSLAMLSLSEEVSRGIPITIFLDRIERKWNSYSSCVVVILVRAAGCVCDKLKSIIYSLLF